MARFNFFDQNQMGNALRRNASTGASTPGIEGGGGDMPPPGQGLGQGGDSFGGQPNGPQFGGRANQPPGFNNMPLNGQPGGGPGMGYGGPQIAPEEPWMVTGPLTSPANPGWQTPPSDGGTGSGALGTGMTGGGFGNPWQQQRMQGQNPWQQQRQIGAPPSQFNPTQGQLPGTQGGGSGQWGSNPFPPMGMNGRIGRNLMQQPQQQQGNLMQAPQQQQGKFMQPQSKLNQEY